jgi:hypothetical protein
MSGQFVPFHAAAGFGWSARREVLVPGEGAPDGAQGPEKKLF